MSPLRGCGMTTKPQPRVNTEAHKKTACWAARRSFESENRELLLDFHFFDFF